MRKIALPSVLVALAFAVLVGAFRLGEGVGRYRGNRDAVCRHALATAGQLTQPLTMLRQGKNTEATDSLQAVFDDQLKTLGITGNMALQDMNLDHQAIERIRQYLRTFPNGYPDDYFAYDALERLGIITYSSGKPDDQKTEN